MAEKWTREKKNQIQTYSSFLIQFEFFVISALVWLEEWYNIQIQKCFWDNIGLVTSSNRSFRLITRACGKTDDDYQCMYAHTYHVHTSIHSYTHNTSDAASGRYAVRDWRWPARFLTADTADSGITSRRCQATRRPDPRELQAELEQRCKEFARIFARRSNTDVPTLSDRSWTRVCIVNMSIRHEVFTMQMLPFPHSRTRNSVVGIIELLYYHVLLFISSTFLSQVRMVMRRKALRETKY